MSRSLAGVPVPATVTPSMSGDLPGGHLDADAGEESDQDGTGQEIRQEPEPGQPGQQQQPAGEQGRQPGQPNVLRRASDREPGQGRGRMAAVAESAPTTRWRDEPRTANTAIGNSSVYRPVTTGIPAIFAYPRTTGMLTAARVIPAITSAVMCDRCTGSSPPSPAAPAVGPARSVYPDPARSPPLLPWPGRAG